MTVHGIPERHFLMIGINANAKLGCDLPSNQSIGHFATGSLCDNGTMLRQFCISEQDDLQSCLRQLSQLILK
jgi:hypothetical protein